MHGFAEPQTPAAGAPEAVAAGNPPVGAAAAESPPQPSCRVCYDGADGESGGVLLAPCQCQGTLRFVHQRCLQGWLQHAPPATRMLCTVCHAAFILPPDFQVPPTDFDPQQVQQQVGQDVEEALAEAEHQEGRWRARQPWPLSIALLLGGAAAGMVAAALLCTHAAKRYHEKQMVQWRQQQRLDLHRWLRVERIPELEARQLQLRRWQEALRTYQLLDRWLPPPLVPAWQRGLERWLTRRKAAQLDVALASNNLELKICEVEVAHGGIMEGAYVAPSGEYVVPSAGRSSSCGGTEDVGGNRGQLLCDKMVGSGSTGADGESALPPSRRDVRQAVDQGGRHNLAEPLLRAVHVLLQRARQH